MTCRALRGRLEEPVPQTCLPTTDAGKRQLRGVTLLDDRFQVASSQDWPSVRDPKPPVNMSKWGRESRH